MRIRTIKPEIYKSADYQALDLFGRELFRGLISYVDDNGVGEFNPTTILAEIFPKECLNPDFGILRKFSESIQQLSELKMIVIYSSEMGGSDKQFVYLVNWDKHQRISHPLKSRKPRPSDLNPLNSNDSEFLLKITENFGNSQKSSENFRLEQGTGNREQGTGNRHSVTNDATESSLLEVEKTESLENEKNLLEVEKNKTLKTEKTKPKKSDETLTASRSPETSGSLCASASENLELSSNQPSLIETESESEENKNLPATPTTPKRSQPQQPRKPKNQANQYDEAFTRFWERYPVKKAKRDAQKAFTRALSTHEGLTVDYLLEKLDDYVQDLQRKGTDSRYIAHAATWLNQERWLDDLSTPVKDSTEDILNHLAEVKRIDFGGLR